VVEEKEASCGGKVAVNGDDAEVLMTSHIEDNTSQGKCLIFDFGSTVYVFLIKRCLTP